MFLNVTTIWDNVLKWHKNRSTLPMIIFLENFLLNPLTDRHCRGIICLTPDERLRLFWLFSLTLPCWNVNEAGESLVLCTIQESLTSANVA